MNQKHKYKNRITVKRARLSTGPKLLIILSLGLLPLGLVAMLASVLSIHENDKRRTEQAQMQLNMEAQYLSWTLSQNAASLRAASETLGQSSHTEQACRSLLNRLPAPGHYSLFAGGDKPLCASPGYSPPPSILQWRGKRTEVEINENGEALNFAIFGPQGEIQGAGEITRERLAQLSVAPQTKHRYSLELLQGDRRITLLDSHQNSSQIHSADVNAPLTRNQLLLHMEIVDTPTTLTEFLLIILPALPIMMWAGAAIISWIIVDRLILIPLAGMEKAVSDYHPGDRKFSMPRFRTLSKEISDLGAAFNKVTRTVASHEADLEAAIERQTRLVREVHHRVKNNLQVIASLLNLHSRGVHSEKVAAAYTSIQRRVDALAVVHRNHYAELEDSRGISLRSLISELGMNLRATAPASSANMPIETKIGPYYTNQDVAVSVAFLITEVVEYTMLCKGKFITIMLEGAGAGTARLTILSPSLMDSGNCDEALTERFNQILTGLARQLRSAINRNEKEGRISIDIAVSEKDQE